MTQLPRRSYKRKPGHVRRRLYRQPVHNAVRVWVYVEDRGAIVAQGWGTIYTAVGWRSVVDLTPGVVPGLPVRLCTQVLAS